MESNFTISKNNENLKKIWELRWSISKASFFNFTPLVDNYYILVPVNLNGLNFFKTKRN